MSVYILIDVSDAPSPVSSPCMFILSAMPLSPLPACFICNAMPHPLLFAACAGKPDDVDRPEDEEAAFSAWQLRELQRVKSEAAVRAEAAEEAAETERRQVLTCIYAHLCVHMCMRRVHTNKYDNGHSSAPCHHEECM